MKSDKKEKKKDKKKKNKDKKLTVKDAKQIKESRQANDLDQQITLSLNDQQEQVQPFVQYKEEPQTAIIQPNIQYGNQNQNQFVQRDRYNQNQNKKNNSHFKTTIDFIELFFYLLEHIKTIVLVTILCGLLGCAYFKFFTTPTYSSTAKLYVLNQNSENSSLYADLEASSTLSVDYKEVFNNWEVTENVRKKLDVNYNDSALQSMISVEIPENTRIIKITAVTSSAKLSADLANAYADAAKEFIETNMTTVQPSIFSKAKVPTGSSSHGVTYFVALAALGGCAISVLFFSVRYLFDNRPKEPNDLAEATGVPTLAVIPEENRKKGRRS